MHKLNLRLPPDLYEQAQAEAAAQHVSLNTYILQAVANYLPYTSAGRERRTSRLPAPAVPSRVQATSGHGGAENVPAQPPRSLRPVPKVAANQPCPCGSRKPYKRCHGAE